MGYITYFKIQLFTYFRCFQVVILFFMTVEAIILCYLPLSLKLYD